VSKKARKIAAQKRLGQKRARKEAMTLQYKEWASRGANTRSKRSKLKAKRTGLLRVQRHVISRCDNIGCKKCVPILNAPEFATDRDSFVFKLRFTGKDRVRPVKPWKTSAEKLAHQNRKRAAKQAAQKQARQLRNQVSQSC
jgi:Pyruvate/2-oxoacid:ferredoxin oxidoreductase delta subunit